MVNKWSISKKSIAFKVPEGILHFPGGGGGSNFFQGGSNCLFPIETQITCDLYGFLSPPLDPHLPGNICRYSPDRFI